MKLEVALDLYARKEASLSKASKIAGLSLEEIKVILASRGIEIRRGGTSIPKIDKMAKRLRTYPKTPATLKTIQAHAK